MIRDHRVGLFGFVFIYERGADKQRSDGGPTHAWGALTTDRVGASDFAWATNAWCPSLPMLFCMMRDAESCRYCTCADPE